MKINMLTLDDDTLEELHFPFSNSSDDKGSTLVNSRSPIYIGCSLITTKNK